LKNKVCAQNSRILLDLLSYFRAARAADMLDWRAPDVGTNRSGEKCLTAQRWYGTIWSEFDK
jgi:hypothetical protein